ncbi:DNRLRE domain-containing protein, partial [Brevibacillus laterosporus]
MPSITFTFQNTDVQDTYITEGSTSSNGGSSLLAISNKTSYIRRSLIKFDIKAIPKNAVIESATLRLILSNYPSENRKIGVHLITQDWNNNTNWNTQPTFNDVQEFRNLQSMQKLVDIPVTSIVQEWVNGTENHGFLLSDQTPNSTNLSVINFYSVDDSSFSNRPTLTIQYKNPTSGQASYMGLVKMGTLRNQRGIKPRPSRPWSIDQVPTGTPGKGNISSFLTDPNIENWTIGDSDEYEPDNNLYWHKIKDGNKVILICDRVILSNVSWEDLNKGGFVSGKTVMIDGQYYKIRLLSGGSSSRFEKSNAVGGAPLNNEWDRFISNEDEINGIPSIISSDFDEFFTTTDLESPSNKFWNWAGMFSFCMEKRLRSNDWLGVERGWRSVRLWEETLSSARYSNAGWRPVLEISNPLTITVNNKPLTENERINVGANDFTVKITANDAAPNGTLQYQIKLNNVVKQEWAELNKDQPVSFTIKNADIPAGILPFTVATRDNEGHETTLSVELTKGKIGKDAQGRTTYTFEYTGKPQTFVAPSFFTKIKYECWGAQGGDYAGSKGGKGGYSTGIAQSFSTSVYYIFVGGRGKTGSSLPVEGGFNGGGGARAGSGGGASDVRLSSWSTKFIVAGGGGGAGPNSNGGAGGGLVGGDAENRTGFGGTGANEFRGGTYNGAPDFGGSGIDVKAFCGGGGGGYAGGGAGSGKSQGENCGG